MTRTSGAVGLGLLLVATLGACGDDGGDAAPATTVVREGDEGSYALTTADVVTVEGSAITVDEVVIATGQGYLVAYADGNGAPGLVLGASDRIGPGTVHDVRIDLRELPPTDVVHLIVHAEDNGNASFDFPDADAPVADGPGVLEAVVRVQTDVEDDEGG